MAAAKVFAIPELLENILIQVGLEAIADTGTTHLQPLTALACLHRVDRTFNATIKGSPTLQRTMFSKSDGISCNILMQRLGGLWSAQYVKEAQLVKNTTPQTPLEWLFRHLQSSTSAGSCIWHHLGSHSTHRSGLYIEARSSRLTGDRALLERFLSLKASSKMESWRQIKVYQSVISSERLSFINVGFIRPKGYNGNNRYSEDFAFADGTTLGDIFEKYAEIMTRTPSQHCKCVKANGDHRIFNKKGREVKKK